MISFIVIGFILLLISLEDIRTRYIPSYLLWGLFTMAIVINIAFLPKSLNYFIPIIISLIAIFIMGFPLYKLGMGGADIKIFLIIAMVYSISTFYIIGLSCILFILINMFYKKTERPFVPYIFFAYVIVIGSSLLW